MPYDALGELQAAVTKTATFNGANYDMKTKGGHRSLHARFLLTSFLGTTAGAVIVPSIEESSDGTNYVALASGEPVTATTAAQSMELFVSFLNRRRYIRATLTVTGGGANSIVYSAKLGTGRGFF